MLAGRPFATSQRANWKCVLAANSQSGRSIEPSKHVVLCVKLKFSSEVRKRGLLQREGPRRPNAMIPAKLWRLPLAVIVNVQQSPPSLRSGSFSLQLLGKTRWLQVICIKSAGNSSRRAVQDALHPFQSLCEVDRCAISGSLPFSAPHPESAGPWTCRLLLCFSSAAWEAVILFWQFFVFFWPLTGDGVIIFWTERC